MAGPIEVIRRRTAAEHVYDELRRAILTRAYRPGAELNEMDVARRLGTSVTPVREAFHKLRGDGLVEYEAWKGSRVVDPQHHDVIALFEVRRTLERLALEASMPGLTPDDRARLRQLCEAFPEPATALDTPEAQLLYDRAFHAFFLQHSHGTWTQRMLDNIRSLLDLLRYPSSASPASNAATVREHRRIVEAVVADDVTGAVAAMDAHLRRVKGEILDEVARSTSGEPA